NKWAMSHGADGRELLHQCDVARAETELVIADHAAVGFAAGLAEFAGVDMQIQAALEDLGRVFEILQQLIPGDADDVDLDVLEKIRLIDHELQPAPGRFEPLHIRMMQDLVDLSAKPKIEIGYDGADQVGVDPPLGLRIDGMENPCQRAADDV